MENFWFYIQLGLNHVLDFSAYDHMLFLCALAIPFTLKRWKQAALLATIFTVAHCISLALSAYGLVHMDEALIEFLIPVTIFLTALFNKLTVKNLTFSLGIYLQSLTTAFFGLIHGFGFSNYFNMILAGQNEKMVPLLGFATGIELSQVALIIAVLLFSQMLLSVFNVKQENYILVASAIIGLITIPMLINTFP